MDPTSSSHQPQPLPQTWLSMSLKVVTVTVWLGWSHCTDSDFAVTSQSRSSPDQTTCLSRCRPLQALLVALLLELLFCLSPCFISSMTLFLLSPVTVEACQTRCHSTASPLRAEHQPRWSPSGFFLLLPLTGRPAWVPTHPREGRQWILYTDFVSCHLTLLFHCF